MVAIYTPKTKKMLWNIVDGYISTIKNNIELLNVLQVLTIISQNIVGSEYVQSPKSNTNLFKFVRLGNNLQIYSPKNDVLLYNVIIDGDNFNVYTPKTNILLFYSASDGTALGSYIFSPKNSVPLFYLEGLTFISGGHGNEGDENFIIEPNQVCGVTTFSTFDQVNLNINNITSQNTQSPQNNRALPCAGVIIHHTAGGSLSGAISTLRNNNLSYHYLIEPNGQISQFTNNNIRGHHAGGQNRPTLNTWGSDPNSATIGIAFVGNFTSSTPTIQALNSCANLIRSLVNNNVIVGSTINNITNCVVAGHFCNQATACPANVEFGRFRQFSIIVQNLEEENEIIYNKIEEVPKWARPTIENYIEMGLIKGDENGELKLTYDMIRIITIIERRFYIDK